jgi:glycosyltransferase involved in cell wall biosynthesis
MVTQELDPIGDVLGFVWMWVTKLSEQVNYLFAVALRVKKVKEKPQNLEYFPLITHGKYNVFPKVTLQILATLKLWFIIMRLWSRRRLNLVFTHMCPEFTIASAPICKVLRIPIVMWYAHKHVSSKLKLAYALSDKVVTSHERDCRIRGKKTIVIGQGITVPKISVNENKNENTIISVGRISRIKAYEFIIKALSEVINELKYVKLKIIGPIYDEQYYQLLIKLIKDLSLEKHVIFVGQVPHSQMEEHYLNSTVFVSACHAFDKAPLEAMAYGLPTIVCDDTFDEILSDLIPYCRYTPGNHKELAQKLIKILSDKKLRNEVGKQLRERVVKGHSVDNFIKKLVEIFKSLTENNKRGVA